MGDSGPWVSALPDMWRAIADPEGRVVIADDADLGLDARVARSLPLVHLLLFSFGWRQPQFGLARWDALGRPTNDARLALVHRVWDTEVGWFADWFDHWSSKFGALDDWGEPLNSPIASERRRELASLLLANREASPLRGAGGGDPLHLSMHFDTPIETAEGTRSLYLDADRRSGVLIMDEYRGWYSSLAEAGAELPGLPGGRSWRIDVVVRPVGWLGTYRRSRLTGRWFAGQHSVHEWGM